MTSDRYRDLPSVDQLLIRGDALIAREGRLRTVTALRRALDDARASMRSGAAAPSAESLIAAAVSDLAGSGAINRTNAVINATGVILHTNLGRAPLSIAAQNAVVDVARNYSRLEYDLDTGERGRRGWAIQSLLSDLTGCDDALVVNNCAGATMLMLAALARDRDVVISRGQLVEIGGGFRVPEIMEQSGAHLLEVGTTNRVQLRDYASALDDDARSVGAILNVHPSNFKMTGFTQDVAVDELVRLVAAKKSNALVLQDLGSGALIDTSQFGLSREPLVQDGIRAGADVVCFSGDKLLGGPQAGVLVGKRAPIDRIRKHPLARAMRADKITLAALEATLMHYARGEAIQQVPVLRMMALSVSEIAARAQSLAVDLQAWARARGLALSLVDGASTVGGGSLPGETLPTRLLAIATAKPDNLAAELRSRATPVITRIHDGAVLLDLRTVLDDQRLRNSLIN